MPLGAPWGEVGVGITNEGFLTRVNIRQPNSIGPFRELPHGFMACAKFGAPRARDDSRREVK